MTSYHSSDEDYSLRSEYTLSSESVSPLPTADAAVEDDRPCLLVPSAATDSVSEVYFKVLPENIHLDPIETGSMVGDVSAYGCSLVTLEFNLRMSIERRDEHRTTVCLAELFRQFVFLNRPIWRCTATDMMERQTALELMQCVGPFSAPASLGMHQRLLVLLLEICVRQIGVATPSALYLVLEQWRTYERYLFHRPTKALSTLLGLGALLCHCKKDASVAYARHVFSDTSRMRDWRNDVLKHSDVMAAYITSTEQAQRARKTLLCNKVFFSNRLRIRRYQMVCIGAPHPEYMCQGGAMPRAQVKQLVNAIRQGFPRQTAPSAMAVVACAETLMIEMANQVNNLYDREAYDALQIDLQIYLYLFQKVLCEPGVGEGLDSLMVTSQCVVFAAPTDVSEAYAGRLWSSQLNTLDFVSYGIVGESANVKHARGVKRKAIVTMSDIVGPTHPPVIAKVHVNAPPSIVRDNDNIPRECHASEIQRHPLLACIGYFRELYCLHHAWAKCMSAVTVHQKSAGSRVVLDRELFDPLQPCEILYRCKETGICAASVILHKHVAAEWARDLDPGSNDASCDHFEEVKTASVDEANVVANYLGDADNDEEGTTRRTKAVLVGPWDTHQHDALEREVARFHQVKKVVGVQPDLVVVKRMILLSFSAIGGGVMHHSHVLGRTYTWVVYVPCLSDRVVMTIDRLKVLATRDSYLQTMAKLVLRPSRFVNLLAVIDHVCELECSWTIGANYVSFQVLARGESVQLKDIRIHCMTESLLQLPGQTTTFGSDNRTSHGTIRRLVRSLLEKCNSNTAFASANIELAKAASLLAKKSGEVNVMSK